MHLREELLVFPCRKFSCPRRSKNDVAKDGAAKDGAAKGKGKGKGTKGGRKGRGVNALPLIPLLTPLTALSLIDSSQGFPAGGSGDGDPPHKEKPEKAPTKARTAPTFWQQCLKTIPGRGVKAGVALATCLSGGTQPESGAIPALAAPRSHQRWFQRKKYYLEYVGDTGAGEPVWSRKAFFGAWPSRACCGQVPEAHKCGDGVRQGGGTKKAKNSIVGSTPLFGNNAMYELANSPIAVPTGHVVIKRRRPYIWTPDDVLYHVIDARKLKI